MYSYRALVEQSCQEVRKTLRVVSSQPPRHDALLLLFFDFSFAACGGGKQDKPILYAGGWHFVRRGDVHSFRGVLCNPEQLQGRGGCWYWQ